MTAVAGLLALLAGVLPFGPGERLTMRIRYGAILGGRAHRSVEMSQDSNLRFVATAKSEGFFAWLFRFRVDDRTVALWDPDSSCSLGIEKHLREGRAVRDQRVVIDPVTGHAEVEDAKVKQKALALQPCVLDLPPPLGRNVATLVIEPVLAEGTGLFVKEGRLKIWLTDDARRIPVRLKSKVAIGSVTAELESYSAAH